MKLKWLYRSNALVYLEDERLIHSVVDVPYDIIRQTKARFVINVDGKEKYVSKNGKNRFAYPSLTEARDNLLHRTKRRMLLLNASIKMCEEIIHIINTDIELSKHKRKNGN